MTMIHSHSTACVRQGHASQSLLSRVLHALNVQRSRAHLKQLDEAQLSDIGVTQKQAENEAKRPIWDVPSHWRH